MTKFDISAVWYPLWAFVTITIVFSVAFLLNRTFAANMAQADLLFSKLRWNSNKSNRSGITPTSVHELSNPTENPPTSAPQPSMWSWFPFNRRKEHKKPFFKKFDPRRRSSYDDPSTGGAFSSMPMYHGAGY